MDGTNSAGRKISLLNDHDPPHHLVRLHSYAPSLGSRTSSYTTSNYATSSIGSPPTPQLVRSHSSDSMDNQTPSPITPDFSIDNSLGSPQFSHSGFFNTRHHQSQPPQPAHKDMDASFPVMSMAYHPAQAHASYYVQQQQPAPAPTQPADTQTASSVSASRPKKNQYPCPLAKQENCHDFFTTSGHAARHSKKHTGRKDAICPECNKAFTRKDNMEQHRRTHKGGRGTSKAASERGSKKAAARAQRPKLSPTQTSTPVLSPAALDPSLPISPTGSFIGQPLQSAFLQPAHISDQFIDFSQRAYPDPTAYALAGYNYPAPPSSDHAGLDVLASAASDTRRSS